ncbi:MAG: hypothetical protein WC087_02275 [Candidatus Paceibacterota bacterium]
MKNRTKRGEVATLKSMLAAFIFTLVALTGCEQPQPLKVVDSREGCILLNGDGLAIQEIHRDGTVSLVSEKGAVLSYYPVLDKPFTMEGIGRKGDPIFIGARYVDNVYENGEINRVFKKVAVASKNEKNWQTYFANDEKEKPPGNQTDQGD